MHISEVVQAPLRQAWNLRTCWPRHIARLLSTSQQLRDAPRAEQISKKWRPSTGNPAHFAVCPKFHPGDVHPDDLTQLPRLKTGPHILIANQLLLGFRLERSQNEGCTAAPGSCDASVWMRQHAQTHTTDRNNPLANNKNTAACRCKNTKVAKFDPMKINRLFGTETCPLEREVYNASAQDVFCPADVFQIALQMSG